MGGGEGCGGRRGLSESFLLAQNGRARPGKITLRLAYFEPHQETEKLKCAPRQGCRSDRADANTISGEPPPTPEARRAENTLQTIVNPEAKGGPDTQPPAKAFSEGKERFSSPLLSFEMLQIGDWGGETWFSFFLFLR